ncbi:hypothetical protein MUK42_35737 [Musa troglodytarum]|uniref:Uncharacterized protein n=1 Tax=Musa troglodytarum TaxID=320322 RepID=A0A9E7EI00_9LILI|nr:hypothetical protein MUK42_35737 [Musa troglodytarum]
MRQSKPHEICIGQAKSQNILHKQSNPVISESGPGRPVKLAFEQKVCNKAKIKQPPDTAALQRKPPMIPRDKSKYIEEAPVQAKLEATKRKLHEGYQQAENGTQQASYSEIQKPPEELGKWAALVPSIMFKLSSVANTKPEKFS